MDMAELSVRTAARGVAEVRPRSSPTLEQGLPASRRLRPRSGQRGTRRTLCCVGKGRPSSVPRAEWLAHPQNGLSPAGHHRLDTRRGQPNLACLGMRS